MTEQNQDPAKPYWDEQQRQLMLEHDKRAQALLAPHGSVSVPLKLLEELIEIACDYINPDGEKHRGVPPFNHGEACRVIREAGDIRDNFEYECRHCGIFHDRGDPFCKPNVELWHGVSEERANGIDHQRLVMILNSSGFL